MGSAGVDRRRAQRGTVRSAAWEPAGEMGAQGVRERGGDGGRAGCSAEEGQRVPGGLRGRTAKSASNAVQAAADGWTTYRALALSTGAVAFGAGGRCDGAAMAGVALAQVGWRGAEFRYELLLRQTRRAATMQTGAVERQEQEQQQAARLWRADIHGCCCNHRATLGLAAGLLL